MLRHVFVHFEIEFNCNSEYSAMNCAQPSKRSTFAEFGTSSTFTVHHAVKNMSGSTGSCTAAACTSGHGLLADPAAVSAASADAEHNMRFVSRWIAHPMDVNLSAGCIQLSSQRCRWLHVSCTMSPSQLCAI